MNVIQGILRRPTWVGVLWMVVTLLGVRAYLVLPQDLFPDTVPPQIVVMTVLRGAGAADINRQVSTLLDRELKGLTGVVKVSATSRDEISSVNVQFDYGTDLGLATNDVVNVVARLKGQFPPGTQEPQIFRVTDANRPLMTLSVSPQPGSGLDLRAVRLLAENDLKEELLRLPGVGKVDVFGAHSPEILVRLDIDRLQQFRLSPETVLAAIGADNLTLPGGYWLNRGRESLVKTVQEARTPAELAAIPLRVAAGGVVTVGDVASITLGIKEPRSLYHGNGSAAIALNILKVEGGNAMAGLAAVKGHLPRLAAQFPALAFAVTTDQQPIIDINLAGMRDSLFSAIWLTMLIVVIFLVEVRTSLIIGISIPLSFLTALAYLSFTDYTLNMVTLSGLIVAVGMVVDASVVVVENVFRRWEAGERTPEVVAAGTGEVVFSILGGMLTTVVVMIPILFVGGYAQQVLRPLSIVIIMTLMGSFAAAVTIVPHLIRWMFFRGGGEPAGTGSMAGLDTGNPPHPSLPPAGTSDALPVGAAAAPETAPAAREGWGTRLQASLQHAMEFLLAQMAEGYLLLLRVVLRARVLSMVIALGLLVVTIRLTIPLIGRELMPPMDAAMVTVNLDLPPATPLAGVEAVVARCEAVINRSPHVLSVSTVVGAEPGQVSFGAGGQLPQQAEIQVRLTTRDRRQETIWQIMEEWRRGLAVIPGLLKVSVKEYGATPMSTTRAPIDVVVAGRDPARLQEIGQRVMAEMMRVPGLRDPLLTWRNDKPETLFRPSLDLVAGDRLSARGIGEFLGVTLAGRYPSRLQMDGYLDLPVRAEIGRDGQPWQGDLGEMILPQARGELFLATLGRTQPVLAPTLLTREDLRQTLDVLGLNAGRPLSAVAADVQTAIDRLPIPGGYSVTVAGSMADMADTARRLAGALLLGFALLYIVLWGLFEDWWRPVLIMGTIPLSLIGAFWGLVIMNKPMCMPAIMGIVLLGGTIVNNAIILIDFIDQARAAGMDRREALFQSVQVRLRPILVTTGSTVLGLLPLVFEQAVGLERLSPLGVVAAFGLTFGTVLTLVFIPAMYDLAIDAGTAAGRWWNWLLAPVTGGQTRAGRSRIVVLLSVLLLLAGLAGAVLAAPALGSGGDDSRVSAGGKLAGSQPGPSAGASGLGSVSPLESPETELPHRQPGMPEGTSDLVPVDLPATSETDLSLRRSWLSEGTSDFVPVDPLATSEMGLPLRPSGSPEDPCGPVAADSLATPETDLSRCPSGTFGESSDLPSAGSDGQAGAPGGWTAQAIIARILQENPQLQAVQAEIEGSRGVGREVGAMQRPQVEAGASWKDWDQKRMGALGLPMGPAQFNDDRLTEVRVQVRQLLWDGGQARERFLAAREAVSDQQCRLGRLRQELVADAWATILAVRTAEALLEAGDRNLADIRSALDRVALQQKAGRAAPVESLRLEARHQDVLETIESWRQARAVGLAHLGALMNLASPPAALAGDDLPDPADPTLEGLPPGRLGERREAAVPRIATGPTDTVSGGVPGVHGERRETSVSSSAPEPAADGGEAAEALLKRAFQERPDVGGAGHQVRRAERTERAQRRAGLPVLALVAGATRYGDGDDQRHLGTGFVGLDLSWSLADGGQRQGRRQQARAALAGARSRLEQLKAGVIEQVHRSLAALQTARRRLERTKAGLAAAEEAHRIEAMKFGQGRGTITDLLDAESALFTARAQDIKAANDLAAARIALLLAVGDPRLAP